MKKKLCYFMGISGNLAFAAANVAIGLNEHNKGNDYDIVIYYSYMENADLKAFECIPNCVLAHFSFPDFFIDYMMKKLPEECRFKSKDSLMCYAHYEAFKLLENYEYVVWLEPDMLIQADITGITKFGNIGLSIDDHFVVSDQFIHKPKTKYKLEVPAYRIGLMVLSDSLPYMDIYKWCYRQSYVYAEYSRNPEQAVINFMLQEFDITPIKVPESWHCDSGAKAAAYTRIIHVGSNRKIWNDYERFNLYHEWYRNHLRWMEIGGTTSTDYKFVGITPKNLIEYSALQRNNPFWYSEINSGNKIIIYGAGAVGHAYVEWINTWKYCEVVAVVDQNADMIRDINVPVIIPEALSTVEQFDYIVIAIEDNIASEKIKQRIIDILPNINESSILENKQRWEMKR